MQNEKRYFASANTDKGFVSYFDEVFRGLDYVYIIKGGPGTGKSSFIRNIADYAEKKGMSIEYFYCSSDPLSLDGIIINDINTAVVDGTAPHTFDPVLPGVKDIIINLSDNWDREVLSKHSEEIIRLNEEKKTLSNNVYNYLSAVGRIESEIKYRNKKLVNYEKMQGAVNRLTKGWKNGKGYKKKVRLIEGISHAGYIVYDTYEQLCENNYVIKDRYGIGGVYLDILLKVAYQKGLECIYSPKILDRNECMALYFPEADSSFIIKEDDGYDKKIINMDRFIDVEGVKKNKQKSRFARRCLSSLYEGVQKSFDELFAYHMLMEKQYIGAMDFSKNEVIADRVKREMFM